MSNEKEIDSLLSEIERLTKERDNERDRRGAYVIRCVELEGDLIRAQRDYAAAVEKTLELRDALAKAEIGLSAGCYQYAAKTFNGFEVSSDEQYPWIRAMIVGREAARNALSEACGEPNFSDDTMSAANAHLIASAPDLYEALVDLHIQCEQHDIDKDMQRALENSAAALSKSRGETK